MLEYLCLQMQPHTRDFFNPNFSTRFCKTYITQITQGSLKNLKVLSFVAIPRPCLGAPTKTASRSPADHPSKSPWQRSPLHDALVLTVAGPPAPWGGVNGKANERPVSTSSLMEPVHVEHLSPCTSPGTHGSIWSRHACLRFTLIKGGRAC